MLSDSNRVSIRRVGDYRAWIPWWHNGVAIVLGVSIALIGIGRIESQTGSGSISAWSVSRTTFFFWLALTIAVLVRDRGARSLAFTRAGMAPLYVFFLVVSLSLLPDFHSAGDYRYLAFACAHGVMVADVFTDWRWLRPILYTLGVVPGVLVVRGLLNNPALLSFDLTQRFSFPLDHPNTAGYVLSLTLPLGLWCVETARGWRRALAVISTLLQLAALLLTYSRIAWIAATVSLISYALLNKHWKSLVVTGLAITIGVFAVPALRNRSQSLTDPMSDASISERVTLVREALRVGWEHPLLGVGYGRGRVKDALRELRRGTASANTPILHTHNVYAELFAGTGMLGLGTFLWLILTALFQSVRSVVQRESSQSALGVALTSAWIAMIICGLGDVPLFHHETRILLFTLFALITNSCQSPNTSLTLKTA
jgi:O-antigen ligase